jgi:hypothetical protein
MSSKILISGCGMSWSGQERPTWVKLFKLASAEIVDVGGPAVSNQWILNRAFLKLSEDPTIKRAVIQLTCVGKLDVEVNSERIKELVELDSLRNFVYQGVWPSSMSLDHPAKQLWDQWLSSPVLELQDIFCKLVMLKFWCDNNGVALTVMQGYELEWADTQRQQLANIITDINFNFGDDYINSPEYALRKDELGVPCLEYQIKIAERIANVAAPELLEKLRKVKKVLAK